MKLLHIREMTPEDIPEISKIERSSFTTPWSETSFFSEVYNRYSITRVAEVGDMIAGYILAKQIADECHLLDIAIHPDYRKQGIATSLINDVLKDLRADGCRQLYLEVRTSNVPARKLYEKFGFKAVGIRKNYYLKPEENALVMMLELAPDDTAA